MRNVCLRIHCLVLALVALMGIASQAAAQTVQPLMQFTNTWRYDQSGRDLSTTKWKTNDYVVDAPWQPDSRGLLGFEPDTPAVYTVHAPITTPLTVSVTVTTFYFRTTFQFSGATNGLSLIASNLVDDGCVIYLNGLEAGRIRVTTANQNATTLGTGPAAEGQLDVVNISPGLLRQGANLMAVEVHQSATNSSDVMFGMKLSAFLPTALAITNQPVGSTVGVGDPVTFTVGVSGGPAFYQWQKDGVNIPGATSNVYTILSAQLSSAGTYRVLVTNAVTTSLFSSPAVLNVLEDSTGPKLVSAVIRLDTGSTNQIVVTFNESILSTGGASIPANYRITMCGTTNRVTVTNVTVGGTLVLLRVANTNWNIDGCYYLTVNNVPDTKGNNINPNSVIGLSTREVTNLFQMSEQWDFYDCAPCDSTYPAIYTNNLWYKTNFVEDPFNWGTGSGIFYVDPNASAELCTGDGLQRLLSFQPDPTLFRRTFRRPTSAGTSSTLRLRYMVDDGFVLYLNGVEVFRANMPEGPLSQSSLAVTPVTNPTCVTNVEKMVTNLLPGTNWLAAAVYQSSVPENDTYFGLEIDEVFLDTSPAPTNPPAPYVPTITLANNARQGTNYILTWPATNYGFALRYSTNIVGSTANEIRNWGTNDSYWIQVKDQSNPYTNAIPPNTGPRRFYRLFKATR